MEHHQILLLQTVVAAFEGNEDFADLLNECDRHITLHANGPKDEVILPDPTGAAADLRAALDAPFEEAPIAKTDWSREIPERLRLLADGPPVASCKGCQTPNAPKDESGNCDICGYPGYR